MHEMAIDLLRSASYSGDAKGLVLRTTRKLQALRCQSTSVTDCPCTISPLTISLLLPGAFLAPSLHLPCPICRRPTKAQDDWRALNVSETQT